LVDVKQFKEHVVKLAKIGMQPVVCGSMGEAFHLSHDERVILFKAAREALDEAGLNETVIIAGTYVSYQDADNEVS
jgi:dihydrodipicolinate synthase/N-acetylneuraminate lyase